jgi:hypothetical protein
LESYHSALRAPSFLKMPVQLATSFSCPPRLWYKLMSTCASAVQGGSAFLGGQTESQGKGMAAGM